MTTPPDLLEQAESVLTTNTAHSNRIACWIARAALEAAIDELLEERQRPAPEASTRSKLTVLQVAFETQPAVPAQAEYAWNGLSRACHQHAYELTPSVGEVRHLLDLVRSLVRG